MDTNEHGRFSRADLWVLSIGLGALLSLTVLLVGCARNSARQIVCKNNLRNLSISANMFESIQGRYPGYDNLVGDQPAGWIVTLLPNLDHSDKYEQWCNAPQPQPFHSELFVCPSDLPVDTVGATNSYVINAGAAPLENEKPANGVAHNYRGTQIVTDLTYVAAHDGAAFTLLMSENVQAGQWHFADKQSNVFVWHPDGVNGRLRRKINGYEPADRSLAKVPLCADSARPSSLHRAGVNVAFCDTRCVSLLGDIDYPIYMQLMTPNGRDADMPAAAKELAPAEEDYHAS